MAENINNDIKSLTSFLALAERIPGGDPDRGTVVVFREKKNKRWDLYGSLQRKVNLLIRNHEILAVAVSGKVEMESGQVTIVESGAQFMLATNPGMDEHVGNSDARDKTKVVVQAHQSHQASIETGPPAPGTNVVDMVLGRLRDVIEKGGMDIPFAEHVSYITTMLARCYHAETDRILEARRDELRTYVFTVGHNKMYRRFQSGTDARNRNFFTHLTTAISEIADDAWAADLPEEHSSRLPKSFELEVIKASADIFSDDADVALNGDEDTGPVYDARGRRRSMLFTRLAKEKRYNDARKALDKAIDREALVEDAVDAVQKLNAIIGRFHGFGDAKEGEDRSHSILSQHLAWLEKVLGVQSRSLEKSAKLAQEIVPGRSSQAPTTPQKVKEGQGLQETGEAEDDEDCEIAGIVEGLAGMSCRPSN